MTDMEFLFDNTLGSSVLCVLAVLAFGWLRLPADRSRRWFGLAVPRETPFIVVSGVCTAVVIPATVSAQNPKRHGDFPFRVQHGERKKKSPKRECASASKRLCHTAASRRRNKRPLSEDSWRRRTTATMAAKTNSSSGSDYSFNA